MPSQQEIDDSMTAFVKMLNDVVAGVWIITGSLEEDSEPEDILLALDRMAGRSSEAFELFATISNRCGVSWDTMAGYVGVTKQSLHRRVARRGEALYAKAVSERRTNFTDELTPLNQLFFKDDRFNWKTTEDFLEGLDKNRASKVRLRSAAHDLALVASKSLRERAKRRKS